MKFVGNEITQLFIVKMSVRLNKNTTKIIKKVPVNKLELNNLNIYDVLCFICNDILIDPITLPCFHNICLICLNKTIENNRIECPLCRHRISSFMRLNKKQLINNQLWSQIKKQFHTQVTNKYNGITNHIQIDEPVRKLSSVGEIRQEYEDEVKKVKEEQIKLQEKYNKESEKLIKELQEEEKKLAEERENKVHQDELLARQLAEDSQSQSRKSTGVNQKKTNNYSQQNGKLSSITSPVNGNGVTSRNNKNKSKQFYDYLAANNNADGTNKINTLDKYLIKKSPTIGLADEYTDSSPPSPELISTAGRCGRFLKNFLTARLWGSSITGCTNSIKTEPKVWEPQDTSAGHSRELTVNTGMEEHHQLPPGSNHQSYNKHNLSMDDSIREEVLIMDTVSEDSLAQELCYFKPLHPEPNMFPGKWRRCIPKKPIQDNIKDIILSDIRSSDICTVLDGLERLKGPEFWKQTSASLSSPSSFVCLVQVPVESIKARELSKSSDKSTTAAVKPNNDRKTIKRKHSPVKLQRDNNLSNKDSKTPTKSPKKNPSKRNNIRRQNERKPLSKSCVKLGTNHYNQSDHVLTRSKRSISFGDVPINGNGLVNKVNNSVRSLRSHNNNNNGLIGKCINNCDSNSKVSDVVNVGKKMSTNEEELRLLPCKNPASDNILTNNGRILFDASLLAEQKRIEDIIAQEKKDYALAKKLQRQFCGGDFISTGYTVRTAAKKQATLRDLLPVAKKMRV